MQVAALYSADHAPVRGLAVAEGDDHGRARPVDQRLEGAKMAGRAAAAASLEGADIQDDRVTGGQPAEGQLGGRAQGERVQGLRHGLEQGGGAQAVDQLPEDLSVLSPAELDADQVEAVDDGVDAPRPSSES